MAIVTLDWVNQLLDGSPLDGVEVQGYLTLIADAANDIDNTQINANAGIAGTKLADGGITTVKLLDLAVTTAKLANLAVTAAKIAPGAITVDKMASDSVDTAQIVDLSVTAGKLASANFGDTAALWDDAADGLQAPRLGNPQIKMLYGRTVVATLTSGTHDQAVLFSTGVGYDGAEAYSSATDLVIVASFEFSSAPTMNTYEFSGPFIHTKTASGFSFRYDIETNTPADMFLTWYALGTYT